MRGKHQVMDGEAFLKMLHAVAGMTDIVVREGNAKQLGLWHDELGAQMKRAREAWWEVDLLEHP